MRARYACGSSAHGMARRQFLGTLAAGAVTGGLGAFTRPTIAGQLQQQQKRVAVFYLHGGSSQFETWDPKPGTDTGGPFLSIPTSVPGLHLSELMPMTAQQMHHLCVVRGMSTGEDDHSRGTTFVMTGRRVDPAQTYPHIGAVASRALSPDTAALPGNITIIRGAGGARQNDAAYLGPQYSSLYLGDGPPQFTARPEAITEQSDQSRNGFRRLIDERFLARRRAAMTEAYTHSFEQAQALMRQRDVFDISKETDKDRERYGTHDIGRHCLMARRLLENGVTFVQVWHVNYDTHNENFNFHLEQIGEFDRAFACFVQDIVDRGMLDSTLIAVVSEFGRTPGINHLAGRDHFSAAWSVCLGGARIPRGAVYGKTNERGTEVVEGKLDAANLFHTYLQAVDVDSAGSFEIDGRDVPLADPASHAIPDLLT